MAAEYPCPVRGCKTTRARAAHLFCHAHWYLLPAWLRSALSGAYRSGQERHPERTTDEYRALLKEALLAVEGSMAPTASACQAAGRVRAISSRQPFASAVVQGLLDYLVRDFRLSELPETDTEADAGAPLPASVWLALHAGQQMHDWRRDLGAPEEQEHARQRLELAWAEGLGDWKNLPRGGVIGMVEITAIVPHNDARANGPRMVPPGSFAWLVGRRLALAEPLALDGARALFWLDAASSARLRGAWRARQHEKREERCPTA